ncbi:LysR family transcriptional regulator [Pseudomonas sp. NUPR-001]|uniref:LysR family transcriptional regulator n=1 Tax=Pseudomonas sp. NUPR-001 TaxID=3416058 RepID=UPI003F99AD72
MDTLGAISMFVATADQGSFSRAAELLGKTPSALTKSVSMLEKQLGTLLFERSTRRIVLTESGRLYLETARQVLRSLHEAGEEISQLHQGLSGTLRLTAPLAFERAFLSEVCAGFLEQYPDIQLRVDLSDDFVDLIDAGYDLGIRQGRSDLPGLIGRVVGKNRIYLCASPHYVARNPLPLSPQTIDQHDWLKYVHSALDVKYWWAQSQTGRIRLSYPHKARLESDSYDLLLQNALAGRGILHTPQWSVERYLRDGRLVRLMEDYIIEPEAFGDDILAVYPSHHRASRKVLAFIDYLSSYLATLNSV